MIKMLLKSCLAACLLFGFASVQAQVVNPKAVLTPNPGYPDTLTDSGISGRAEVDITIKADGSVAEAELAMADQRAFGKAAMAAVKVWKFEPATRDGTPIEIRVTIPFIFPAPIDQQVNALSKRKVFVPAPAAVLSLKDYGSKLKLKREFTDIYARPVDGKDVDENIQVDYLIAPDGTTLNPTISGTPPKDKDLQLSALLQVARASYAPPLKNGQGVYVAASVKLHFTSDRTALRGGFGGGGGGMGGGGGGGRMGGGGGGGGGR